MSHPRKKLVICRNLGLLTYPCLEAGGATSSVSPLAEDEGGNRRAEPGIVVPILIELVEHIIRLSLAW